MRRDELATRKAELEARIAAHRRRMVGAANEWREAVRPVDDAWRTLVRWKVPLALAGGAILWRLGRRGTAQAALKWWGRGLGVVEGVRLAHKLFVGNKTKK
ncbi:MULTISPECIES: YqjK family protein [Tepidiphilus]|uniref:YqjK-like protein n=1 Tax=Tepidiphilus baoligensis TaxID=2698687 RepID=A0ABX1QMD6_9PROT|nr:MULTISPECIES: YqjK family protein [Tepidiphilus]NMH16470.1 hypothetical protein [Tepidiphilus baoligensis]